MTKKELSEYMSKLGKKGGARRAKILTPERRKEIATIASNSREMITNPKK